jgi:hypothetical protein
MELQHLEMETMNTPTVLMRIIQTDQDYHDFRIDMIYQDCYDFSD